MRFLIEGYDLTTIKQSLIKKGIDLTSSNGGKCIEASEYIRDNFGYNAYICSVFPHNSQTPIVINQHCVNIINGNVVDFTASQYAEKAPCPIIAKYNKKKDCYESELFDYYLGYRR